MKEITPNQTETTAAKITATALRRRELATYGEEDRGRDQDIQSRRRRVSTRARQIVSQARDRYSLEKLAV